MKKRIGLLVLTFVLLTSGISAKAAEKNNIQTIGKYFNFVLDEVKGTGDEESISSLKDSLEQLLENLKPEDANKIFQFLREKIDEGKWNSEKGIQEVISEGEKKFNVTLTKEQKDTILSAVSAIKNLGISPEYLVGQMEEIYQKYGEELKNGIENEKQKVVEKAQNKIKQEINKTVTNYFSDMVKNVKSFVMGIFR